MSTGPLNSPGVRIIIIDQTISIAPTGSPVEVDPFRTPIRGIEPPPPEQSDLTCGDLTSWTVAQELDFTPVMVNPAGALPGFATAMSDDGSVIVVGAPREFSVDTAPGDLDRGAAYVYEKAGGVYEFRDIFSPTNINWGGSGDFAGTWAVTFQTRIIATNSDASVIVTGAPGEDTEFLVGDTWINSNGTVYVHHRVGDSWEQVAKLSYEDTPTNFLNTPLRINQYVDFGTAVALKGDGAPGSYIFIGVPDEYEVPAFSGANRPGYVNIFKNNGGTWEYLKRFTAPTFQPWTYWFGLNLVISRDGNTLVVFAPDDAVADTQTFYVYRWDDGTEAMVHYATLNTPYIFGTEYSDIAISDDGTRVVTAQLAFDYCVVWEDQDNGSFLGTQLVPDDPNDLPGFGYHVAICGTGEVIMVTNDYQPNNPDNPGGVFIYKQVEGVWTQIQRVENTLPTPAGGWGTHFGNVVGLGKSISMNTTGDIAIVTAIDFGTNTGRAIIIQGT